MMNRSEVSEETKVLVSYIPERFENEPNEVKAIRASIAVIMEELIAKRNSVERGEKSRNYQIAITHLEEACMRAVKAAYL